MFTLKALIASWSKTCGTTMMTLSTLKICLIKEIAISTTIYTSIVSKERVFWWIFACCTCRGSSSTWSTNLVTCRLIFYLIKNCNSSIGWSTSNCQTIRILNFDYESRCYSCYCWVLNIIYSNTVMLKTI